MSGERERLLGGNKSTHPTGHGTSVATGTMIGDIGTRSQPSLGVEVHPALMLTSPGMHNSVQCQVCQTVISLEGKMDQLVVKCSDCAEATPIRPAPPGKKYVRCSCHCLLICKTTSLRVACPRPDCRRIVNLAGSETIFPSGESLPDSLNVGPELSNIQPNVNVVCARCGAPFVISAVMGKSLGMARCPHCSQLSSVGPSYVRIRWSVYGGLGLLMLIAAITTTVTTVKIASENHGLYALWAGECCCVRGGLLNTQQDWRLSDVLYLVALFLLIRCIHFLRIPISLVEYPLSVNS